MAIEGNAPTLNPGAKKASGGTANVKPPTAPTPIKRRASGHIERSMGLTHWLLGGDKRRSERIAKQQQKQTSE